MDYPKGEPENPMTNSEFRDRYDGLMKYANQANSDEIFELVYGEKTQVEDIMKLL